MKLVDILALELKVWPDDWVVCSQDSDSYIAGYSDPGLMEFSKGDWSGDNNFLHGDWLPSQDIAELASDYATAIVTRAEWQAAVDALSQEEWSEDGLPNVGTKCVIYKGTHGLAAGAEEFIGPVVTVTARFKSARGIEMACVDSGDDGGCHVFRADMCFHLPTAEEIAAEEREKAIKEMTDEYLVSGCGILEFSKRLYEVGYRKQVTK